MPQETMLIIDGNSLAYRAFHAIPLLTNSEGITTNAAYGFTNMLFKVLLDRKPDYVAVAFDKGKITFRHERFKDYKVHRKATPDDLRPQFPLLKDILKAMQIPVFEIENFEADDIIGTLATAAEKNNLNCLILSGDQDIMQLITSKTHVLYTKKGISQLEEYDIEAVKKRFGVLPEFIPDLKGLTGDPSDNIPGVPGIGIKTASKLLQQYESLDRLIEKKEELPPRWRNKLRQFEEQALMSKELAAIECCVPVEVDIELCRWPGPNYPELLKIFSRLEFKTLIKAVVKQIDETTGNNDGNKNAIKKTETYQATYSQVTSDEDIKQLLDMIKTAGKASFVVEENQKEKTLSVAISLAAGQNYCIEKIDYDNTGKNFIEILKTFCADTSIKKYCHDAKTIMRILHNYQLTLNGLAFDTMLAAYLLNPGYAGPDLDNLVLQHLNIILPRQGIESLAAKAESILKLYNLLNENLEKNDLADLYYNVELPLISVLADMEKAGVAVDASKLKEMSLELGKQIERICHEIYSLAGEIFNINSPRQLGSILFEKLQLPVIKRTKTSYSTNAAVLEELTGSHPIIEKIIEYRQLTKLKSTYVDGITQLINKRTGKLHTTFHQTVTATGRLSSSEPNLQNIPIRLEQGRKIRKAFIPREKGNLILTADYSQIELRILAHMSGDFVLREAFWQEQDIHTRTASEVFATGMDSVTKEMRNRAKAVNFGIIYGMSEYGLSRDIKVSRNEAKMYIENYFARYSGVQRYIKETIENARKNGFVTTILKRRRYLPDLFSSNRNTRNFGERTAVNTPIQGSAADIIKLAMVNLDHKLKEKKFKAKMVLQVHDELIFDVPANELRDLKELVKDSMENAINLKVPLIVDLKAGNNWYDVEKI